MDHDDAEVLFTRTHCCAFPIGHEGGHKTELDLAREALTELRDVAQMVLDHDPGDPIDDGCRDALKDVIESTRKQFPDVR